MFINFFKKLFSNKDTNIKKKTVTFKFLLKEIWFSFKMLRKRLSEKTKKLPEPSFVLLLDIDKILLKVVRRKVNKEVNKRVFQIKEEFLHSFLFKYDFFKKEWTSLYRRSPTTPSIWAFYTQRFKYIFGNNFYLRQKKMAKLFNINNPTPGKYEHKIQKNYKNIYWGFISFWCATRIWLFSLLITSMSFYILLVKRASVLPQATFFWISFSMLLYWLLSGFVFFVKKYQFSRFTSVIQRFWRRSYILFWLIEGGLLLVFFYLMVNSSQESFYMFDQGYFFKTHLFSWKIFIFKCLLVVSLIAYSYFLLLNLKWSTFNKNIINLLFLSIILIYFVWTEFYQIYWVSNFYANFSWSYDTEDGAWVLEFDGRRTRILNHYVMILFLLKFWHIIFIFGCWIFFLLRASELETITYPLYSFNFQNFIILFLMMWLFMYPWFKHCYHWLAEITYYWFYVDIHVSFYKILINDAYLFYYNVGHDLVSWGPTKTLSRPEFINWFLIDSANNFDVFIKSTIKNEVLQKLV